MAYTPLTIDSKFVGLSFAKRTYLPRVVGLGLGLFGLSVTIYPLHSSPVIWGLLIIYTLVWPHIAYQWSIRSEQPLVTETRNLLIDSLLAGVWIAVMGFSALPTIVFLAMMGMNNTAAGSYSLFLKGLAAQIIGAILTSALLGFPFTPQTTPLQLYFYLPVLFIYPVLFGLVTYRTAKHLVEKKREVVRISMRDGLTGVYNRRHWEHLLRNQFDSCRRYNHTATLILIDIDRFKAINDTFGHALGDEALIVLAEELVLGLRTMDIVGRYGGDEFGALLPNTPLEQASQALSRIQEHLREVTFRDAPDLKLYISAGIADYQPEMKSYQEWLKAADNALYLAKSHGRNRMERAVPQS